VINGEKIAVGMAKELEYQVALTDAKSIYTTAVMKNDRGVNTGGLGWDPVVFHSVDWKARKRVWHSEMRSLWLIKQEIGINRTRRNNARIMNILDDKCPNCEQHNEDSKHLNLCPDAGRSKLHREGATKLRRWMSKTNCRTEPTMARVLYDFIRLRNSTSMEELAQQGSPELIEAAKMQDRIGWLELMQGKLAVQLVRIQEGYCASNNNGLDGKSWSTNIITKLLEMSHSQWLYRNFSLHHHTLGYLHRLEEKNLRKTARELAALQPEAISATSQYLLEIDIEAEEQIFTSVSYWVLAMKAALKEKIIANKRNRQQRRKDMIYGRNWTLRITSETAAMAGKRDHSSMVAIPKLPRPKRSVTGGHNTAKRWKQQTITTFTKDNTYKQSQRRRSKNECRLIIYETNNVVKQARGRGGILLEEEARQSRRSRSTVLNTPAESRRR